VQTEVLYGKALEYAELTGVETVKYFSAYESIRCLRHFFHHSELKDESVKKSAISILLTVTGGFPSKRSDWEKLHFELVNQLVIGLQEVQQKMFEGLGSRL
jgi:hypothetical protein